SLLRIFPIIVSRYDCPGAIVQLDGRISQCSGHTKLSERWSQCPQQHLFAVGAADDKARNQGAVAGQHFHPGRDVEQIRGLNGQALWKVKAGSEITLSSKRSEFIDQAGILLGLEKIVRAINSQAGRLA